VFFLLLLIRFTDRTLSYNHLDLRRPESFLYKLFNTAEYTITKIVITWSRIHCW